MRRIKMLAVINLAMLIWVCGLSPPKFGINNDWRLPAPFSDAVGTQFSSTVSAAKHIGHLQYPSSNWSRANILRRPTQEVLQQRPHSGL